MQTVMNYPIRKNEWVLSNEDIVKYLQLFPKHDALYDFINPWTISSQHRYKDGLIIHIQWVVNKTKNINLHDFKVFSSVVYLMEKEIITLYKVNIVSYSVIVSHNIPQEIEEKFKSIVNEVNPTKIISNQMPQELYRQYEFNTSSRVTIPDEEFDKLMQSVQNYGNFFKYLEQRENI